MDRSSPMFFHHTDSRMIPYLGPEFVRALLGLDACDGAADAPLDLNGVKPTTPAKMKAQSDDCRYTAQRITPNCDKNSSLPESNRESGWPTAKKTPLSGSADPNLASCTFLITPGDSTKRETLTTPLRGRSVVFSLWNRLVHWLNRRTGVRER